MENLKEEFNKFMLQIHYEQIPIKNLTAKQDYQRKLSISHVKRAVANFNPYQINLIKVSRRDGINYVVNGQHTIEIVASYTGSRETPVWCMIFDDLKYEQEADLFANQQKYVKALTPYEIFMANIEAGNDEQIMIKDIVEKYGLVLSGTKTPGGICAIATLEDIFHKYGYHTLDDTLRLCIATWEGENNSFSSNILRALARIIDSFKGELDEEVFKDKVGYYSIRKITRKASEYDSGSLGFAEVMIDIYNNSKTKNALDKNKLSKKKLRNQSLQDNVIEE